MVVQETFQENLFFVLSFDKETFTLLSATDWGFEVNIVWFQKRNCLVTTSQRLCVNSLQCQNAACVKEVIQYLRLDTWSFMSAVEPYNIWIYHFGDWLIPCCVLISV